MVGQIVKLLVEIVELGFGIHGLLGLFRLLGFFGLFRLFGLLGLFLPGGGDLADFGLQLVDILGCLGDGVAERDILGVVRVFAGDVVAVVQLAEGKVGFAELILLGENADLRLGDRSGALGGLLRSLGNVVDQLLEGLQALVEIKIHDNVSFRSYRLGDLLLLAL